MNEGPAIDYEALAQDALRGVVRTVLSRAAKSGLPGDHHFYVSFHTQAPGVTLSKRLREKYPREMTIVLQHRFWDLTVTDDRFDVKLTFDGIPERIIVPFVAIKVFFDPSVRYGMQFEEPDGDFEASPALNFDADAGEADSGRGAEERTPSRPTTVRSAVPRRPRVVKKPRNDKEPGTPVASLSAAGKPAPPPPAEPPAPREQAAGRDEPSASDPASPAKPAPSGAEIVRLDAFRKK